MPIMNHNIEIPLLPLNTTNKSLVFRGNDFLLNRGDKRQLNCHGNTTSIASVWLRSMDQLPPFVSANMVNRNTLLFSTIGFLKRNKMDTMVCSFIQKHETICSEWSAVDRPHFKITVSGTRIFGFANPDPPQPSSGHRRGRSFVAGFTHLRSVLSQGAHAKSLPGSLFTLTPNGLSLI